MRRTLWRRAWIACLSLLALSWTTPVCAGDGDISILSTRVRTTDPNRERALEAHAKQLDRILLDAAPDLGLTPRSAQDATDAGTTELDLPRLARDRWVLLPALEFGPQGLTLRLSSVAPGSRVLLVRVEHIDVAQLEVRTVVMLQELIESGKNHRSPTETSAPANPDARDHGQAPPSTGRAVLALNSALYGGYIGFTAHRGSGSKDARLLYPLTALGAGLGLGASMLVADEWDISQGSAWYLSAGLVWPSVAGMSLSEAYDGRTAQRHLYGLLGATSGLALATTMASLTPVTGGHAALAHSGGSFGVLLGGLGEALWQGKLSEPPWRGVGYGSLVGVVTAGALAPVTRTSASRILFIDLSASLGALTGAAVATPLLLVRDEIDDRRSRVVSASVIAGTLLGGALGTWITQDDPELEQGMVELPRPHIGAIGVSESPRGKRAPIFGLGLSGAW